MIEMLKFAGIVLASMSALWGLSRKLTFEDENENKRLTADGYLAGGIIIASLLVSAASLIAESLSSKNEKRLMELTAATLESKRLNEVAFAESKAQARADMLKNQANANATEANLLAASLENKKLARDVMLSRLVAERTNRILTVNSALMNETQRIIYGFNDLEVDIEWCIHRSDPFVEKYINNEFENQLIESRSRLEPGLYRGWLGGVKVDPSSSYYARLPPIMAINPSIRIMSGKTIDSVYAGPPKQDFPISVFNGWLHFRTSGKFVRVPSQTLPQIRSVQDLENATIEVEYTHTFPVDEQGAGPVLSDEDLSFFTSRRIGIMSLTIDVAGRQYHFPSDALKSLGSGKFGSVRVGNIQKGRGALDCISGENISSE